MSPSARGELTAMIELEDRVTRQTGALKTQQVKIENLTRRVIRLETQLELLTSAAMIGSSRAIERAR